MAVQPQRQKQTKDPIWQGSETRWVGPVCPLRPAIMRWLAGVTLLGSGRGKRCYFGKLACLLKDGDVVAGAGDRDACRKTAQARADDGNIELGLDHRVSITARPMF